MSLGAGARIGPYEILSLLGRGGMGEVYRARDSKLGRDVALKVLPSSLSGDTQRMARFAREAQLLASLNHPNIAAIYGLEQSGGIEALVMELVEGTTLAERLAVTVGAGTPALPVDETLAVAKQIAEGLEAAHERGIIHRDLKPANIKITPEGTVKLLDFGLAKALDVSVAASSASPPVGTPPLLDSPTLSAMATQAGMILGTAAYMSPEQAKGKPVDRRADIWAFGCVLYEMLTGKQVFQGETITDILAAVVRADPELAALPADTPPRIRELLQRSLHKDPRNRLRDIGDARIAIEETLSGTADVGAGLRPAPTPARAQPLGRRALSWAAVAILLAATAVFAFLYFRQASAPTRPIIAQILPPPKQNFIMAPVSAVSPAVSPDGNRLVFLANGPSGKPLLWVRSFDSLEARPLEGTENAYAPFWSPDGRYLGFFANEKLKKIEASGGPPQDLCPAPIGRGGSWAPDGTILFAPSINTPLYRISASGGAPVSVTNFNKSRQEGSHRWPQFLPDSQHFLFYAVSGSQDYGGTYVGSLEGGEPKLLLKGDSNAIYASPGYLLFVRGTSLMAQRFDPARLELSGDPAVIAENVAVLQATWRMIVSASQNAVLVFSPGEGSSAGSGWPIVWFDRKGKQVRTTAGPDIFADPRLSPDGKELAVTIGSLAGNPDIWTYDLAREARTRLTFEPSIERSPVWSPDGTKIAFTSDRKGRVPHIYEKAANGTGTTEPLLEDDTGEIADSWSADGRYIAYERQDPQGKTGWDIWILPTFGDRKPFPFLASQFSERFASFSPDGKWLAYSSDESGAPAVYVAPFPQGNGKWEVSTNGGDQPHWRRDGRELYYMSLDQKLMAVDIREKGSSLEIGTPQPLFQTGYTSALGWGYDVTADGKEFVVLFQSGAASSAPITLVLNWPALFKK